MLHTYSMLFCIFQTCRLKYTVQRINPLKISILGAFGLQLLILTYFCSTKIQFGLGTSSVLQTAFLLPSRQAHTSFRTQFHMCTYSGIVRLRSIPILGRDQTRSIFVPFSSSWRSVLQLGDSSAIQQCFLQQPLLELKILYRFLWHVQGNIMDLL